jgi:tetratricopeptide (TPR) repeat protein
MGRDVAEVFLQRGQTLEAEGRLDEAIASYDRALAVLRISGTPDDVTTRHALGLTWMNRGNAFQKLGTPVSAADAVQSYDEAITFFRALPRDAEPRFRNHLGAAWLNRGHALLLASDAAAIVSFENAIAELATLPLETDPFYRLNLAGAHANLAHAKLANSPDHAAEAARAAVRVVAEVESTHVEFAAMSLRARRALVMAIGALLTRAEAAREPLGELASEATDAIDDGLALARELETQGVAQLRPLAVRLFRLGAQLYGTHQPHFLGEFIVENLSSPAFAADADFRAVANEALTQALALLQRPNLVVAGTRDAEKLVATARSLRAAQQQLSVP